MLRRNILKLKIDNLKKVLLAQLLKIKYSLTIKRLKKVYGKRKLVVAFCVSEVAKWKAQSLYDKLEKTAEYTPIIYVYPSLLDFNQELSAEELLKEKMNFFKEKGLNVASVWDSVLQKCVIPQYSRPDIIFYQQPWDIPPFLPPREIADYALSFYIPYYLVNNFNIDIEFGLHLHHFVFGYIVQNEEAAKLFTSMLDRKYYAGSCIGLGHTIVDSLTENISSSDTNSVIYAPHFSIPAEGAGRLFVYSTFLDNGRLILQFAKEHPEIDWVFKPHPRLRFELEHTKAWTKAEIDAYYEEWEKIGTVCTTSDYVELFQNSSAMITDCGSFLTEYSCMDKPLIRLYYHKENLPPNPILKELYKTFYYAHNNDELQELLNSIICRKEDTKKSERHREVSALGLNKSNTAQRIVDYLNTLLSSKHTHRL